MSDPTDESVTEMAPLKLGVCEVCLAPMLESAGCHNHGCRAVVELRRRVEALEAFKRSHLDDRH